MEQIAIVGLPNSGKSSLFNALTGAKAPVAKHPFSTTETMVGIARVPDPRLGELAAMSASRKVVPATVEWVDIAGLAPKASSGEGLGNRFLAGVREADALCMVLRAFEDEEAPGDPDALSNLEALELELIMADLATVEAQLPKRQKAARAKPADRALAAEAAALEAALPVLSEGTPIFRSEMAAEDRSALASSFLLTDKPVLAVVNLAEADLSRAEELLAPVRGALGPVYGAGDRVLGVSVGLEAEAAELDEASRVEMMEGFGLGEGALARLARASFQLLGRRTFFTTGDTETRAWTYRAGSRAPQCAGVIHSDLERGFIRAEVIGTEELLRAGSWAAAKEVGKLRLEGKDYVVRDGDVLEIRFNV
ncbi:MAG: redox-regulated ATPase YchF [Acidimicrobiales bacterium]